MENTMLYKWPGLHPIHDDFYDYLIVGNVEEHDAAIADGWVLTTPEAIKKETPKAAKETKRSIGN